MRYSLALLLIPIMAFSVLPIYRVGDPALVFENSREFFNLEIDISSGIFQNLLTGEDFMNLINGSTITIDESRLDLIKDDLFLKPGVIVNALFGFGYGNFRFDIFANVMNTSEFNLPGDVARLILGGMDFEEDIHKEFNLIRGGIFAKAGVGLGFKVGNFVIDTEGGLYLPLACFDEDYKSEFVYVSDPDSGSINAYLKGESKFYTPLSSFNIDNIDKEEMLSQVGYFIDLGIAYRFENLLLSLSIDNISIKPSYLKYQAYAYTTFSATYDNLDLETSPLEYGVSDSLETLDTPKEISIPMYIKMFVCYEFSFLKTAIHGLFVPDYGSWNAGLYLSVEDILWIDTTYVEGYWKKTLGLNFDLRLLRLTAEIGAFDTSIVNIDVSKMTGINAYIGAGLGF